MGERSLNIHMSMVNFTNNSKVSVFGFSLYPNNNLQKIFFKSILTRLTIS